MEPILEEELRTIIMDSVGTGRPYVTQKALAQAMKKSTQYVSMIFLGKASISDEVARFFGRRLVKTYPKTEGDT